MPKSSRAFRIVLAAVAAAHAAVPAGARDWTARGWQVVTISPAATADGGGWTTRVILPPGRNIETAALPGRGAEPAPRPARLIGPHHHALDGIASYYWQDQMTASGERFNKRALTAAHKTLPIGTRVRVTRLDTGRSVDVRINDRGPYKPGRVIDLSEAAAEALGMTGVGLTRVNVRVVSND